MHFLLYSEINCSSGFTKRLKLKKFPSMAETAKETGVDKSSIGKVCNGKIDNARGFFLRYA